LTEALGLPGDSSYHPVTQVLFEGARCVTEASSPPKEERETALPGFDLEWGVGERDGVLELELRYAEDLFEASTARRMLGHWQRLIQSVAANPEERVGELAILEDQERRVLLEEWTATEREHPTDK